MYKLNLCIIPLQITGVCPVIENVEVTSAEVKHLLNAS